MDALRTRPEVARAFDSLTIDIPPDATPDAFLGIARDLMDRYGGADPERALRGIEVVPVDAGGVAAEYLIPPTVRTDRRFVYLHGGAWIAGGLKAYRLLGAELARASGCAVLVVDYRLAPEHPFPAGLDDATAAFDWARANGPGGPGQAEVCLSGDSAGANLAAALCVRRLAKAGTLPHRLALLCGVLDLDNVGDVARHDPLCSAASLAGSFGLYTQGRIALDDPLVSPIKAASDILARFPPTLVQVSGAEYLLGGSRRFAARMIDAGARTVLSVWPDMPHSWQCFVDTLPEAKGALGEIADFFNA